jgi:hypothetical protein
MRGLESTPNSKLILVKASREGLPTLIDGKFSWVMNEMFLHEELKKKIITILQQAAIGLQHIDSEFGARMYVGTALLFNCSNIGFILNDVENLKKLSQDLLKKKDWGMKFSEDDIIRLLEPLIVKVKLGEAVEEILRDIDQITCYLDTYSTEQIIFIPLIGITMDDDIDSLSIGDIILKKMTSKHIKHLAYKIRHNKLRQQKTLFKHFEQYHNIFIEHHIQATPNKAREIARLRSLTFIDLLRLIDV